MMLISDNDITPFAIKLVYIASIWIFVTIHTMIFATNSMTIATKDICGNIGNYIVTIFYFVARSINVLQ
jgi:hypothetical protein